MLQLLQLETLLQLLLVDMLLELPLLQLHVVLKNAAAAAAAGAAVAGAAAAATAAAATAASAAAVAAASALRGSPGRRMPAHHGAGSGSPKVRRHVGGDGDRRDHRVHGSLMVKGLGASWTEERRLESSEGTLTRFRAETAEG